MKASTRSLVGLLVVSSLTLSSALSGCSRANLHASRSGTSEEDAKKVLDARLLRTEEVNAHLSAIREALKPVEAVFNDLGKAAGKAVDLRIDGQTGNVVSSLVNRLDAALREAGKGLVQERSDGTWVIERLSPLALEKGPQGTCVRSRVRVTGDKLPSAEKITIAMSKCTQPDQFDALASLTLRSNGDRDLEIFTAAFEGRRPDTINIEPCHMRIEPKGHSSLTCSPMTIESKGVIMEIQRLDISGDTRNIQADVRATVEHKDRFARFSFQSGLPVPLELCVGTRGGPCLK